MSKMAELEQEAIRFGIPLDDPQAVERTVQAIHAEAALLGAQNRLTPVLYAGQGKVAVTTYPGEAIVDVDVAPLGPTPMVRLNGVRMTPGAPSTQDSDALDLIVDTLDRWNRRGRVRQVEAIEEIIVAVRQTGRPS